MTMEVWAMMGTGVAALVAGLALVRTRFDAASDAGKVLVLGPVFEAVALAVFAAEHFTAARDLMGIVPKWLPGPLFWTYFVGAAWLAAAISFIVWRQVRWSAAGVALLMWTIVATIDLPNLSKEAHDRIFWILTVRELAFGAGAMVLAGSLWRSSARGAGAMMMRIGRGIVAATMIFYGIEHFLFPLNVPGVPLELLTPAWMPAPRLIAYMVGMVLLAGGMGLFIPRRVRGSAAGAGVVVLLLTALFYVPIFVVEMHGSQALEGLNYVGDTLLWAATVLLAGLGTEAAAD
ncbi:MAG: hypothetical protein WBX09_01295 [Terracidiphilus sp.]